MFVHCRDYVACQVDTCAYMHHGTRTMHHLGIEWALPQLKRLQKGCSNGCNHALSIALQAFHLCLQNLRPSHQISSLQGSSLHWLFDYACRKQ